MNKSGIQRGPGPELHPGAGALLVGKADFSRRKSACLIAFSPALGAEETETPQEQWMHDSAHCNHQHHAIGYPYDSARPSTHAVGQGFLHPGPGIF